MLSGFLSEKVKRTLDVFYFIKKLTQEKPPTTKYQTTNQGM